MRAAMETSKDKKAVEAELSRGLHLGEAEQSLSDNEEHGESADDSSYGTSASEISSDDEEPTDSERVSRRPSMPKAVSHQAALSNMVAALDARHAGIGSLKEKLSKTMDPESRPLDAPLPRLQASRIKRSVAFEKTTEEVSKWAPVVQRNRRARSISFPMNEARAPAALAIRDSLSTFETKKKYEEEVDTLLKAAGLDPSAGKANADGFDDDLPEHNPVTKEELLERRRELARMRSVVFDVDRKMKRIKKIKSRRYRKRAKTDLAKLEESGLRDRGEDEEADHAEMRERERVEERMNLRHKNTSKWVKRQLTRGEARRNPETRAAIEEQLRLHQELRKKQLSSRALAENGADSAEDSDSEDMHDSDAEDGPSAETAAEKSARGLMSLNFMKAAEEKKKKELEEAEAELRADEHGEGVDPRTPDETRTAGRRTFSGRASETSGAEPRKTTRKSARSSARKLMVQQRTDGDRVLLDELGAEDGDSDSQDEPDPSETVDSANASRDHLSNDKATSLQSAYANERDDDSADEQAADKALRALGISADQAADQTTTTKRCTKAKDAIAQHVTPAEESGDKPDSLPSDSEHAQKDEAETTLRTSAWPPDPNSNPWLQLAQKSYDPSALRDQVGKRDLLAEAAGLAQRSAASTRKAKAGTSGESRQAHHSKSQTGSKRVSSKDDDSSGLAPKALQEVQDEPNDEEFRAQQVASAFAGAGGVSLEDFKATKKAAVEKDMPTARDVGAVVLPGWGRWSGPPEGKAKGNGSEPQRPAKSKFALLAEKKLAESRAKAVRGRQDAGLDHVLITAKRAKKATSLTMSSVPFPYTNADQWEKELGTPLARERSTYASHQRTVTPAVTIKRGEASQPLQVGKGAVARLRKHRAKTRDSQRRAFNT